VFDSRSTWVGRLTTTAPGQSVCHLCGCQLISAHIHTHIHTHTHTHTNTHDTHTHTHTHTHTTARAPHGASRVAVAVRGFESFDTLTTRFRYVCVSPDSDFTETNHQSPITGTGRTITNHQSPITNHQSPITNHQSPITNHQSPVTNHQSPITNHQSPITNHRYRAPTSGNHDMFSRYVRVFNSSTDLDGYQGTKNETLSP
jgi:hypothetical protein